jgi:hypothetical protein
LAERAPWPPPAYFPARENADALPVSAEMLAGKMHD